MDSVKATDEADVSGGTPDLPLRRVHSWLLALALGVTGFLVNGLPVPTGWSLDFLLGGTLAFAALRLLSPMQIVVAGSIAAARTIWLWNHPWAWLIWTIEAAVIGALSKRASPIRHDVLFWLLAGAPLIWLTYGGMLQMDGGSVLAVILKHGINGAINVTLGELIYTAVLFALRQRVPVRLPPISIDSAILALMISVAAIPAVIWLRFDAPHRESWVHTLAETRLTKSYQDIERKLAQWRDKQVPLLAARATGRARPLPSDFATVGIMRRSGQWLRPVQEQTGSFSIGPLPSGSLGETQLLTSRNAAATAHIALVTSAPSLGADHFVAGILKPAAMSQVMTPGTGNPGNQQVLLIAPSGAIAARTRTGEMDEPWLLEAAVRAQPDGRTIEARAPRQFGTAPMTVRLEGVFVTAHPSSVFPGWKIVLLSQARDQILAERQQQIQVLALLAGLIVLLTLIATALADGSRRLLERMAQALTNLAVEGGERADIQLALVSELGDIATGISLARSRMEEQRQALIANRRRLEIIIEHGGLVIYTVDLTNPEQPELTFLMGHVETLIGYRSEDVSAREWLLNHVHPDDLTEPPLLAGPLLPGHAITGEYRLRHKQGHYVWVHDCLVADDGPQKDAVGFLIDISDRKAAAEKLVQASKMESLGRMAAGVAHELNQPLNFISLAAQNLHKRFSTGAVDPAYATDKLERIMAQIRRASLIVGQVRTFGRSVAETAEVVPVTKVIHDVASLLKGQLDLKGIALHCETISPDIAVRVHPVRLGQVLINLVINARDSILLRRETRDTPATITLSVHETGGFVEIAVADTGTGIAPDKMPFLFEPFFTTKSPQEGTGLGLSVSYGIISDVGGTIRAENTEDGARFVISLPSVAQERAAE